MQYCLGNTRRVWLWYKKKWNLIGGSTQEGIDNNKGMQMDLISAYFDYNIPKQGIVSPINYVSCCNL